MPLLEIVTVFLLVIINGFFAMSEMAVVSARRGRLQAMADKGNKGAKVALELAGDPSRFLSAVQIGITLIGILAGAFSGATLADALGEWLDKFAIIAPRGDTLAIGIVVVAITFLSLIFGELVPKRLALARPEAIAIRVSRPLAVIATICRPVVIVLGAATALMLRLLGVRADRSQAVTEEEVKSMIAEGTEAGVIDPVERAMMEGVLRLADRPVRAIMTPRRDVFWIDLNDEAETMKTELRNCTYSRIVAVRGGKIDEPVGVVQKKDLLDTLLEGGTLEVAAALIQPVYVPDGTPMLTLLDIFRTRPIQMAFVVDEYGGFEGVVTLTDVLTAITGDLPEEHTLNSASVVQREDGSFLVDGRADLHELEAALSLSLADLDGDFHTVAGLVLHHFRRLPAESDSIAIAGWRVEVVDMDGRRIDKLLFSRLEQTPPTV
jgi:putative hemolysin